TPIEDKVASIWSEVLGVTHVGAFDSFFELGGHSLRATQIVSRLRDAFGIELSLASFFAAPTVAGLAGLVANGDSGADGLKHFPIRPAPRQGNLPLSFPQERVWFIQQLDPGNVAYNFQATFRFAGPLDISALERTLSEIVRRHEIFRTTFPAVD